MENVGDCEEMDKQNEGSRFQKNLLEKLMEFNNDEEFDEETTRMVERIVILRISTKHINLWLRQLEMKRNEICELAGLLRFEAIMREIERENSLEGWARRRTNFFTKKVKMALYEVIDNVVWTGREDDITQWCKRNKVYDEIREEEIEEIRKNQDLDGNEPIRLN